MVYIIRASSPAEMDKVELSDCQPVPSRDSPLTGCPLPPERPEVLKRVHGNHACSCATHMSTIMCRTGSWRANAHEPDISQQCPVFPAKEFHMIRNASIAMPA